MKLTASVFIRAVLAVGLVVAEESLLNAFAVSAGKFTSRADGVVRLQPWHSLARSCHQQKD